MILPKGMKGEQEGLLRTGKQVMPISREKIIAFKTNRKIIQCAKYGLYTMNSFVNLQINDRY